MGGSREVAGPKNNENSRQLGNSRPKQEFCPVQEQVSARSCGEVQWAMVETRGARVS